MAPECIGELKEMRRSLMEDYKVSPEVVRACAAEISGPCNDKTMLREGRVLHCLMDLARPRNNKYHYPPAISSRCRREVRHFLWGFHFCCIHFFVHFFKVQFFLIFLIHFFVHFSFVFFYSFENYLKKWPKYIKTTVLPSH